MPVDVVAHTPPRELTPEPFPRQTKINREERQSGVHTPLVSFPRCRNTRYFRRIENSHGCCTCLLQETGPDHSGRTCGARTTSTGGSGLTGEERRVHCGLMGLRHHRGTQMVNAGNTVRICRLLLPLLCSPLQCRDCHRSRHWRGMLATRCWLLRRLLRRLLATATNTSNRVAATRDWRYRRRGCRHHLDATREPLDQGGNSSLPHPHTFTTTTATLSASPPGAVTTLTTTAALAW